MSEQFDDPQLKEAVQQTWGADAAPGDLRARVSSAMDARSRGWRAALGRNFLAMAVAAVVLFGVVYVLTGERFFQSTQRLPDAAAAAMVQTHDRCCKLNDHHFVPARYAGDMTTTGRWLSSKAHVAVLAVALRDGWTYCGAGPCPVAGKTSGHLLFRRQKQELSIFSIPAGDFAVSGDHDRYAADLDGHFLAGFSRNGGLYCVVGHDPDGKLEPGEISDVAQLLRNDFPDDVYSAAGHPNPPQPPVAVILND